MFAIVLKKLSCWLLVCALKGEAGGSMESGLKEGVVSGVVGSVVNEMREMGGIVGSCCGGRCV